MLERAERYGLGEQYMAITAAKEQAEKAKPLAEFTAAALKGMVKRDVAGGKGAEVTEIFELTQAVRTEAGVVPGAEVSALPEEFSAVKSMLQNPLLQKTAQGDDPDKFKEAMELAKIVAKKGAAQVGKVNGFIRGSVKEQDLNNVMKDLPNKNDPEQVRAAMVQMLSKDKDNNQEVIDRLLKADLNGIKGESAGVVASAIMAKAKGNGADKGPAQPKGADAGKPKKSASKLEEGNVDEGLKSVSQPKGKEKPESVDKPVVSSGKGQDGRDGQPGRDGQSGQNGQPGQTVVVRDGRDGAPGQSIQSQPASQPQSASQSSQPTSQSQPASSQQQVPEKGRAGFEAKDIMDADAPSHGSYKTARNIAIVCAILFILSGGALGIFLLGALLAGGAAVHYKGEMQTEKQQIAKQRNIEQGLLDPSEVRQQQMEQQMSQEMGQLKQQLRGEQQAHSQMQQELHALQQPQSPQTHSGVDPSVSPPPGRESQGADQGHGPQMPRDVSEKAAAVAREKATHGVIAAKPEVAQVQHVGKLQGPEELPHGVAAQPEVQGAINALAANKKPQPKPLLDELNKGSPEAARAGLKRSNQGGQAL